MPDDFPSAVPGDLRGLEYLHKSYCSLPWSTLFQPAIRTARYGFPVTEDLISYIELAIGDGEDFLCKDPSWALDFCPNGTRLGPGETITRERYANTLEAIANHGPDVFYNGPIAQTTINAVQAANGTMALEDLQDYTVLTRDTAQIDYRGYRVTSTTSPSSGIIALSILGILDTYDDFFTPDNVNLSTHRLDEAIRFGYGEVCTFGPVLYFQLMADFTKKTLLGDPLFLEGINKYETNLLKQSTIDEIRSKISDHHTQNVSVYDPLGLESLKT